MTHIIMIFGCTYIIYMIREIVSQCTLQYYDN